MSGITSAYAAGYRARTKVYRGLVEVTMMTFDADGGGFVEDGEVKSFEIGEGLLQDGAESFSMNVAEDAIATPLKLANCQFLVDGEFHKVTNRVAPIGHNRRLWKFRLERAESS